MVLVFNLDVSCFICRIYPHVSCCVSFPFPCQFRSWCHCVCSLWFLQSYLYSYLGFNLSLYYFALLWCYRYYGFGFVTSYILPVLVSCIWILFWSPITLTCLTKQQNNILYETGGHLKHIMPHLTSLHSTTSVLEKGLAAPNFILVYGKRKSFWLTCMSSDR